MAVIGNRAAANDISVFKTISKQTITGTGATSYALDLSVGGPNDLEVFVNNVRQEPSVAYNVGSGLITFTEAVDSTDDCYLIYQGGRVGTVTHPSDQPLEATTGTFAGTIAQSKAMTTQYDGIGVRMGSSTANTNRGATFLQHTYVDGGGNQGNYVYNHSLRQNDGTYIANVYTADYSVGVHSWYHPNGGLSGNPVMQIDSVGRVTKPYQPHYVGIDRSSTLNTTSETTFVDWVHSNTKINTGSHMNTSTGVFTCPIAGRYFVQFNVLARATAAHNVEIRKNNAIWVRGRDIVGTAGNEQCTSLSTVVDCAANDNIRISVSNANGGDYYVLFNSTTIYLLG